MADPVLSISAATSLGRNYATLNALITSNGTLRNWWNGRNDEDETDITESISDTEYFFEFVNGDGTASDSPILAASADIGLYSNDVDYPPVTKPIKAISSSDPITVTQIAYMLTSGATYYVRLCAKRILWPGAGNGERYRRENQPFELFFTAPISFILPTGAQASQSIVFTGTPANNDTVTVNGRAYTLKTTLTGAAYEVHINGQDGSLTNLKSAINAFGGVAGTDYGAGTIANPDVTCGAVSSHSVSVYAKIAGTAGNAITLAKSGANITIGGSTLSGGT